MFLFWCKFPQDSCFTDAGHPQSSSSQFGTSNPSSLKRQKRKSGLRRLLQMEKKRLHKSGFRVRYTKGVLSLIHRGIGTSLSSRFTFRSTSVISPQGPRDSGKTQTLSVIHMVWYNSRAGWLSRVSIEKPTSNKDVWFHNFLFFFIFFFYYRPLFRVSEGDHHPPPRSKILFQLLPYQLLVQWFGYITAYALLFVFSYTMSGISLFLPTRQKRSTSLPSKVKEKLCCLPRQNRRVLSPIPTRGCRF